MIGIRNLQFQYDRKTVFDDVTITFKQGHVYGILGKNGTGKSTLLYNIAGLLKPTSGSILVNGFEPAHRSPDFLRNIFMVPEEFHLPDISIKAFVRYYSPFYTRFDAAAFYNFISIFEIDKSGMLDQMSYGQRKKVFISFALASNASVVLMDEPSNGLDIIGKEKLRKIIAGSITEDRILLISSHQVQDLENLIDEVVILDNSNIVLHQNLSLIASRLSFRISFDTSDLTDVLYSEPVLRGYAIVSRLEDKEESRVDLELLYKATINNPKKIQAVLTLMD